MLHGLVVAGAGVSPTMAELGTILVLLLSSTTLAVPVVGIEADFLNQPVVWGTGHNRRGLNLYCHN